MPIPNPKPRGKITLVDSYEKRNMSWEKSEKIGPKEANN